MRILHLVRSIGVGGLERMVLGLTDGLAKRGIDCHLGCLMEPGCWADRATVSGTWVGELGNRGRPAVILDLLRYVRKHGVDLIHSHNPEPHLMGCGAALLCGIPVIHTKHGRNYPDDARRVWLNRQLAKATKKIAAVSEDVAKVAIEIEKVPAEKVVVIRNGVEIGRQKGKRPRGRGNVRGELGIAEDAFVVGSVGRFSPEKNYRLLIRAFSRFRDSVVRGPASVVCLLVGDGPERPALERLAAELGLTDVVRMPGMRDDVGVHLAAMDVFCLSSTTEGTSVTLLEAGAAGLPSVVTGVGGNAEVVADGLTGRVVPPGDEAAFSRALAAIYGDADGRNKMGSEARKRIAEKYSLDMMVAEYVKLYTEVLG